LREKGGLLVPRWERGILYLSNGESLKMNASEALAKQDILLISREWARLPSNREIVMKSPKWHLVLLDEAHAARRTSPEEREFNSGNLLLQLMREFQLKRQATGILLLSATPMQTQPWEPWDLLAVLGIGGEWMVEFNDIRTYYNAVAEMEKTGIDDFTVGEKIAKLIVSDCDFPQFKENFNINDVAEIAERLVFSFGEQQKRLSDWLRKGSPLGRRMHRNTRDTLRKYYQHGLLEYRPPERNVRDELFDYEYQLERDCYNAITDYINTRYEQFEDEKKGKGFVMTVYRRRAASSPHAIRCSLERRLEGLDRVIRNEKWSEDWWESEDLNLQDLVDADIEEKIDSALPTDPKKAQIEKEEIVAILNLLSRLNGTDSKFAEFWKALQESTSDGRSVLIFTEYTDTMDYIRNLLCPSYGKTLGTYSGAGGQIWDGKKWQNVSKAEITEQLAIGKLRVLVCTDAASEGLNLQAAGALINYDLPWNPSKVEQRIGRIDRIGQKHVILPIRNLFLNNSVDLRVYEVLRKRCRLFEHFVGRMQPVLALARQALKGIVREEETDVILEQLKQKADEIEKEQVIKSVFTESEVAEEAKRKPLMNCEDFDYALELLQKAGSQIKVKKIGSKQNSNITKWLIDGLGKEYIEVTTSREILERDKNVIPLTATSTIVEQIANRLPMPNLCPLVLEEARSGSHRCVEARWIGGEKITKVTSLEQLMTLVESWGQSFGKKSPGLQSKGRHGNLADANNWLRVTRAAQQCAQSRVEKQQAWVKSCQENNISQQISAAKLRLKRELGRTLRCFGSGSLNTLFKQLVQRNSEATERYRQALEKLGGYPNWTDTELESIGHFVEQLTPKKQRARLLGSEIDAALADPRWKVTLNNF